MGYAWVFFHAKFEFFCTNAQGSEYYQVYGILGDYVGGILGTILTAITLIFVYLTYSSQKIELELQRKLISQQQFESTFFNMLNVHRDLKNSFSIDNINGANVFKYILDDDLFARTFFKSKDGFVTASFTFNSEGTAEEFQNKFYRDYDNVYKKFEFILNPYCINIYYILKFINDNEKNGQIKNRKYSEVFKSQLNSYEINILKWTLIHINEENNNLDIVTLIKYYDFLNDYNGKLSLPNNRKFYDFDVKK